VLSEALVQVMGDTNIVAVVLAFQYIAARVNEYGFHLYIEDIKLEKIYGCDIMGLKEMSSYNNNMLQSNKERHRAMNAERQRKYMKNPVNKEKHRARMRAYYRKNKAKLIASAQARNRRVRNT